jgi:hypothetical protein
VALLLWVHTVSQLELFVSINRTLTILQPSNLLVSRDSIPSSLQHPPSNEQLVKNYGATHFFDRYLSSDQFKAVVSEVTDSPIGIVYDAISLPETQKIGWGLLSENGILILTLAAAVEEDEGKGRKAIPTHGTPHAPENQAAFGLWSRSGSQRASFRSALLSLFESFHEMHLFSLTNTKSFRTGLKASMVGWRG